MDKRDEDMYSKREERRWRRRGRRQQGVAVSDASGLERRIVDATDFPGLSTSRLLLPHHTPTMSKPPVSSAARNTPAQSSNTNTSFVNSEDIFLTPPEYSPSTLATSKLASPTSSSTGRQTPCAQHPSQSKTTCNPVSRHNQAMTPRKNRPQHQRQRSPSPR